MDEQPDRLYELLPYIYRRRDAEMDYPMRDLLHVITEQVNLVEEDITQLYDNWFIETCQEWAIPYIGDLIGYRLLPEGGEPGDPHAPPVGKKIWVPRREVANTIRYRRRKGTLPLLEELAWTVAGWYAHAEEKAEEKSVPASPTPALKGKSRAKRASPAVQEQPAWTETSPEIHLSVWRLKTYKVDRTPACCVEEYGDHCYTFSALGNDTPLYNSPRPEPNASHIAQDINLPVAITCEMLNEQSLNERGELVNPYYGLSHSLVIWAPGWPHHDAPQPIPFKRIKSASLDDWQELPLEDFVAVDPESGRFAFPPTQLPPHGVWVTYHYAFSADIGGGAYERPIAQLPDAVLYRVVRDPWCPPIDLQDDHPEHGKNITHPHPGERRVCRTIGEALTNWRHEKPQHAVIEIATNHVYEEPITITLDDGCSLQLRASNGCRPVLRLPERRVNRPDGLNVRMASGSHFTLDGLVVTGPGLRVQDIRRSQNRKAAEEHHRDWALPDEPPTLLDPWGERLPQTLTTDQNQAFTVRDEPEEKPTDETPPQPEAMQRPASVTIRHCTLVPGWTLEPDCEPGVPTEASLKLSLRHGRVAIEHSILGSIQVTHNEVKSEPLAIAISDSIVDATRFDCNGQECSKPDCEALGAPGRPMAHAILTLRRCTILGCIQTHAIALAENSIFMGHVRVARRQIGCMRLCYVTPGSRTPPRHHCEPDLTTDKQSVRPKFNGVRYGQPAYCQLSEDCANAIRQGADDGAEIGVFHDLYQPQRKDILSARLKEYSPVGMEVSILYNN